MTTIYLNVTDLLLSATIIPVTASGNVNSIRIHATFDVEWDGYGKTAMFYTSNNAKVYESVLSSTGYCNIPSEVLQLPGNLFIGIKGIKGTSRKNTSVVRLKLLDGAPLQVVSDPSDTVYEQILAGYNEAVKCAPIYIYGAYNSSVSMEQFIVNKIKDGTIPTGKYVQGHITYGFQVAFTGIIYTASDVNYGGIVYVGNNGLHMICANKGSYYYKLLSANDGTLIE